jgi:hypothetical protein
MKQETGVVSAVRRAVIFAVLTAGILAGAGAQTWKTGEITFELKNGTLTVSGKGNMVDDRIEGDHGPSITGIVIKDGVTSIGNNAFMRCSKLTSVVIPGSVESIGKEAFSMSYPDCPGLKSITIPEGVKSIGNGAFQGCVGLVSVAIPGSVTSIGYAPFGECFGLTSINVNNKNPAYCSVDGVLFNKARNTLVQYPAGRSGTYVIPDGVTNIEVGAFAGCSNLTSVIIPSSVTSIGEHAFTGCRRLVSVTIPNGITTVRVNTFYNCAGLTSITIPEGVTTIEYGAFGGCVNLTSIIFPSSVIRIGENVFSLCSSLKSVTSLNPIPPVVDGNRIIGSRESGWDMTLYVPADSKKTYLRASGGWRNFSKILSVKK